MTISKGDVQIKKQERGKTKKRLERYVKPAFVIMGAQHAREVRFLNCAVPNVAYSYFDQWVATATSLYLAHALTADASEPHSLSPLLDVFVRLNCLTAPRSSSHYDRTSTSSRRQTQTDTITHGRAIVSGSYSIRPSHKR
jgi:hypothetical protein